MVHIHWVVPARFDGVARSELAKGVGAVNEHRIAEIW